jgi:hypothetical protein
MEVLGSMSKIVRRCGTARRIGYSSTTTTKATLMDLSSRLQLRRMVSRTSVGRVADLRQSVVRVAYFRVRFLCFCPALLLSSCSEMEIWVAFGLRIVTFCFLVDNQSTSIFNPMLSLILLPHPFESMGSLHWTSGLTSLPFSTRRLGISAAQSRVKDLPPQTE